MDITRDGAVARCKALAGFAVNAVHDVTRNDWTALGHALTGIERTLAELREYQASAVATPRLNMFAIQAVDDDDADERGSEG